MSNITEPKRFVASDTWPEVSVYYLPFSGQTQVRFASRPSPEELMGYLAHKQRQAEQARVTAAEVLALKGRYRGRKSADREARETLAWANATLSKAHAYMSNFERAYADCVTEWDRLERQSKHLDRRPYISL